MVTHNYIEEFEKSYRNWVLAYNALTKTSNPEKLIEEVNYFDAFVEKVFDYRYKIADDTLLHLSGIYQTLVSIIDNYLRTSKTEQFATNTINLLLARKDEMYQFSIPLEKMFLSVGANTKVIELEKSINTATSISNKLKIQFEDSVKNIDGKVKQSTEQLNRISTEMRPLMRVLELAKYSDDFASMSIKNEESANKWLFYLQMSILVFIFIVGNFVMSAFEFNNINSSVKQNANELYSGIGHSLYFLEIGKAIFYRLIILSIGTFIIKACYTNYRAEKHNCLVNSHKDNSMKGAIGLINSATDESVKDHILQLAASAVFSHQPTGYNDKEVESMGFGERIIEKIIEKVPSNK